MNQHQQQIIEYLRAENRVLREQLGDRRLRFNDDQRRRLAAQAKGLGRKLLAEVATLVQPETLLAWHRKLIAQKYDGSAQRPPGRPRTAGAIEALVVRLAEENRTWGLPADSGSPFPFRTRAGPQHHRQHSPTARNGARSRTKPEGHLEGIFKAALGIAGRRRLLHGGSRDAIGTAALCG